jgi:hypothetical protein
MAGYTIKLSVMEVTWITPTALRVSACECV